MDDFANYPQTIGEKKSDDSGQLNDWKARDILISMLRDIDSGKSPNVVNMIICYRVKLENGDHETKFYQCGDSGVMNLGVLEHAKALLLKAAMS